jgi:hypothetical protein
VPDPDLATIELVYAAGRLSSSRVAGHRIARRSSVIWGLVAGQMEPGELATRDAAIGVG